MEEAPNPIRKLKRRYLLTRSPEVILAGLSGFAFAFAISTLADPDHVRVIPAIAGLATSIAVILFLGLNRIKDTNIVRFLNRRYPELEESADLVLATPEVLTTLQRIQRNKVARRFSELYPTIRFPHHAGRAIAALMAALALAIAANSFSREDSARAVDEDTRETTVSETTPPLPIGVDTIAVNITPPAYTGLKSWSTTNPNVDVPEGSRLRWEVSFSKKPASAWLVFTGTDSLPLKDHHQKFHTRKRIDYSSLYQLGWKSKDHEDERSDYYRLGIVADRTPEILITDPSKFVQITEGESKQIGVKAHMTDDYGVRDAWIVATVSKGSGESVKFREEKIKFSSPRKISGRKVNASLTLDLATLGLEPGDELYFYVEAFDNKAPNPNRARSETFFIQLADTARQSLSVDGSLGVDLMPEYFRSQRQIIIDSEKLLRERKNISEAEFNARSNELGYDQKVLRLRYGQFLGEEFESAIGQADQGSAHEHDDSGEQVDDPTAGYRHDHDGDNEHNLVPAQDHPLEDHDHAPGDEEEEPWEAYKHVHDDPEEATFFSQSIRAKLKAALTVMWDAELHLRMFDPGKSLPYQYQALKLLKEISNDSRIYVHKTGFDAPPLKEDKRLTGDLSEVGHTRALTETIDEEPFPALRRALVVIEEKIKDSATRMDEMENRLLLQAGQELAELALQKPGMYLETLSQIKAVTSSEGADPALTRHHLLAIRSAFWKAIPRESPSPGAGRRSVHPLDSVFIRKLQP